MEITLTAAEPDADCTFTDRFTKGTEPPTPPTPDPDDPGGGVSPSARPAANLVITKRVSPATITFGATARYTVTITNRGPDTAEDVTAVEVNGRGANRRHRRESGLVPARAADRLPARVDPEGARGDAGRDRAPARRRR